MQILQPFTVHVSTTLTIFLAILSGSMLAQSFFVLMCNTMQYNVDICLLEARENYFFDVMLSHTS